jgi:soluble lytic murein transglycosylase-like protein
MTWALWAALAVASAARVLPKPTAAELQRAAIRQQMESVGKQADGVGLRMRPGDPAPAPGPEVSGAEPVATAPACDAIADSAVSPLIDTAAKAQGLDNKLVRAVIEQESAYRPCAVSSKGAQGLMQLMPDTAGLLGVQDPFDPKENIDAGTKYLKQLLDKYKGDVAQALGAYNAGPGTVDQAGGVPEIPETKSYVDAILKKLGIAPPGR